MPQLQAIDVRVNREFAVHFGAIYVHLKRDVFFLVVQAMAQPDSGGRSVSELTDHTVLILEDVANPYWILLLRFVAVYCLFLDCHSRVYADMDGGVRHSG